MGEEQSTPQKSYFESISYVQASHDPNHGSIDIYKLKQPPYTYLLDLQRTFVDAQAKLNQTLQHLSRLKTISHKNIAQVIKYQLIQENNLCIQQKRLHLFAQYYNFTLDDAITLKKHKKSIFSQEQLVYLMSCMLEVGFLMQKNGVVLGDHRARNVYLSPQGYLKVYLLGLQSNNTHSSYFKALDQPQKVGNHILAPQQLYFISQLQLNPRYDIFKAQVFNLGMLMVQLITLDDPRYYYISDYTIRMDKIFFDIDNAALSYSFAQLLRKCLDPRAQYRISFHQALAQINKIRQFSNSNAYYVQLQKEKQDNKTKRSSGFSTSGQRSSFLSSSGQRSVLNVSKLKPSPINSIRNNQFHKRLDTNSTKARSSRADLFTTY